MNKNDLSHIRGIVFDVDGVLSPSVIPLYPDGVPMRMVNIKDGYALQLAVKRGLRVAILSGAHTLAVERRFAGLGIEDIFLGVPTKLPVFDQWLSDRGLKAEEVIMVGDDIPDIPVMRRAGLSVAPADAAPEVKEVASWVSSIEGGHGIGRELIEMVLKSQDKWMNDEHAFGW